MIYRHFYILILPLLLLISVPPIQTSDKVNLCYFSKIDICPTTNDHCRYILDNILLNAGLVQKIENESHFGPNGIIKSKLELKKLPYPSTSNQIEDCECDIFFTGAYPIDTIWNWVDNTKSGFPERVLEEIKKWSISSNDNVVIMTQGETNTWGYESRDSFENIGEPVNNGVFPNPVFQGAFGNVPNFEQSQLGFHGVFTKTPEEDSMEVLGADKNGLPSIVLDKPTNDIMVSDFGTFIIGGGDISLGPEINNNADVLALNIIAYAVQIAQGTVVNQYEHTICQGENIPLPNGAIAESEGLYIDTLFTIDGCDSIIMNYVNVTPLDSSTIEVFTCPEQPISVYGQSYFQDESGSYAIQRSDQCDSMVLFEVKAYPEITAEIEDSILVASDGRYTFNNIISNDYKIQWSGAEYLSCEDCPNPVLTSRQLSPSTLEVNLTDEYGCQLSRTIDVKYNRAPFIPSAFSPNNDGINDEFRIYFPNHLSPSKIKNLSVYGRWGDLVYQAKDFDYLNANNWWTGSNLNVGVYTYQISVEFPNGEVVNYSGDVNLMR